MFFRDMKKLRSIIKNHLSEGIVLMDLVHNTSSDFVKVIIDSFNNINIKEISKIARRIKNDDKIVSIFPNGCRLEVTTTGLGSKLVKKFQEFGFIYVTLDLEGYRRGKLNQVLSPEVLGAGWFQSIRI